MVVSFDRLSQILIDYRADPDHSLADFLSANSILVNRYQR
jgi:hypothetical protein